MSILFLITLFEVFLLRGGLSSATCRETASSFRCQDLTELPSNVGSNVNRVDVSYSRFTVIDNKFFRRWNEVRVFLAAHSNITAVERGAFRPLVNLTMVDLSFNQLKTLHWGVFEDNYRLDVVYLQGNPLTVPAGLPILQSHSLSKLHAGHTKINHFTDTSFSLMTNVRYLSFEGNAVVKFRHDAIRSLRKLEKLIFGKPADADCYQQTVFQSLQKIKEQTDLTAEICPSEAATPTTVGRKGGEVKDLMRNTASLETRSSTTTTTTTTTTTDDNSPAAAGYTLRLAYYLCGTAVGLILLLLTGVLSYKKFWSYKQVSLDEQQA